MILSCPSCRTRYVVPDSAVGPHGRQVRCAACSHSWYQEAPQLDLVDRAAIAPPPPIVRPEPAPTAVADVPEDSSGIDAFAHEPPFRPRRNPARLWTIAAVGAALLLAGGIVAVEYVGTPTLFAELGLPTGDVDVPLLLEVPKNAERRTLKGSTNEVFELSGKIINPTDRTQPVPDLIAELRDAQGRVVYGWTIKPKQRTIAPRGTVDFYSAEVNVPKASVAINISFSGVPPK